MTAGGLEQRWRIRELASDDRSGRFARGRARRRQHEFVREQWARLLAGFVMLLLPGFGIAALLWFRNDAHFAAGLLVGASVAGGAAFMIHVVVSTTGSAPIMMGDQAEQWTAQELRKWRRDGWRVVHHVMLRAWDIDHVLVGPGGVIAVETKWSGDNWRDRPERVRQAAYRTADSARDLSLWLKPEGAPAACGLVVLWGGQARDLGPTEVGGVTILHGASVAAWRRTREGASLSADQIDAVWRKLDRQCEVRDAREQADQPLPRSVLAMSSAAGAHIAIASLAIMTTVMVFPLATNVWVWLGTLPLLAAAGWLTRRWIPPSLRGLTWSWGAGVIVTFVAVVGTAAREMLMS